MLASLLMSYKSKKYLKPVCSCSKVVLMQVAQSNSPMWPLKWMLSSNPFRLRITYLEDMHSYKSCTLINIHFWNPLVPFALLVSPEKILFCLQKCLIYALVFHNIYNTIIPFHIYLRPPHLFLNDRYFERLETSCFFSRHRSMSCTQSVCSGKEGSWVESFNKGATGSQGLKSKPLGSVLRRTLLLKPQIQNLLGKRVLKLTPLIKSYKSLPFDKKPRTISNPKFSPLPEPPFFFCS